MSCYKTSNNRFFNSTSRMSDGRNFTDYRPNYEMNTHLINNNKISNSHDYRMFLNRNAENIMNKSNEYMFMKNGSSDCVQPFEVATMLPERTRVLCDKQKCEVKVINENGFGQGREYVTNGTNPLLAPLKEPEYKLPDNACADPFDNFNYYPIMDNYDVQKRQAVPGGGEMLHGGDPSIFN
jgi:hypothetical protein